MHKIMHISGDFRRENAQRKKHNYAEKSPIIHQIFTVSVFPLPFFASRLYKREVLYNVNGIRVNVHVAAIFTARFRGRFRALLSALSALYIIHGSALAVNKF